MMALMRNLNSTFVLSLIMINMKKEYIALYLTVSRSYYGIHMLTASSFSRAYKDARDYCKASNFELVGVVEKQAFKDNCQIFNI